MPEPVEEGSGDAVDERGNRSRRYGTVAAYFTKNCNAKRIAGSPNRIGLHTPARHHRATGVNAMHIRLARLLGSRCYLGARRRPVTSPQNPGTLPAHMFM